ncbi:MAG: hypothetical protein N3E51_00615 [Candidatus Micrarchaeota archaeon]|nr:hypothetical protein [Candidatus Micrarchaeota archaeon]
MRSAAAIVAFLLLFFISGCAQRTIPSACASSEPSRLANCIYNNAVTEQNPYYCYSLEDKRQREICMRDAADPNARKALLNSLASEREAIFVAQEGQAHSKQGGNFESPEEAAPQAQAAEQSSCAGLIGTARDNCFKTVALESQQIAYCESISDATIRKSCISEIARKTKDIQSCKTLSQKENINLCNLYVKGDEQKG